MGVPKKKQPNQRVRRAEELAVWPDGRTANDRFLEAFMDWKRHAPDGKRRTEKELERACNVHIGRAPEHDPPYVSQSVINQLKTGRIDASNTAFMDVLAEVLGYRAVWIKTGAGEKKPIDAERLLQELIRKAAGNP